MADAHCPGKSPVLISIIWIILLHAGKPKTHQLPNGILLLRLFPCLWESLPAAVWYVVAVILFVRVLAYTTAAVKYHRFASLHTWLNKLTGGVVFLLPYVLAVSTGIAYSWAVCFLALAASLEELMIHLCHDEYRADRKTFLSRR